ncbi:MAG: hypothetical protein MZV64_52550 [Ignavibacteriales bacterium]|nr:hypothetical protein [Ignavibacteriales bacterium]
MRPGVRPALRLRHPLGHEQRRQRLRLVLPRRSPGRPACAISPRASTRPAPRPRSAGPTPSGGNRPTAAASSIGTASTISSAITICFFMRPSTAAPEGGRVPGQAQGAGRLSSGHHRLQRQGLDDGRCRRPPALRPGQGVERALRIAEAAAGHDAGVLRADGERGLRREAPGPQARLARLLDRRRGLDVLRDRAQPDRPQRGCWRREGRGGRGQARSGRGVPLPGRRIGPARTDHALRRAPPWGAYNSIDAPWSELARGQWAAKSGFAYDARETSRTLLRRGTEALSGLITAGGPHEFGVFNPLSGRGWMSSGSRFRRARCARPRAGSGPSAAGRQGREDSRVQGRMP